MVPDGEAAFLAAAMSINAGLIDLVEISGQVKWVENVEQLAELLDRPSGWELRFTRWLRILFLLEDRCGEFRDSAIRSCG